MSEQWRVRIIGDLQVLFEWKQFIVLLLLVFKEQNSQSIILLLFAKPYQGSLVAGLNANSRFCLRQEI